MPVECLGSLVARNVRAERNRLRWTQSDLAVALGTSQTAISSLEAGRRRVSPDDLLRLCRVLGVPLGRLLVGTTTADLQTLGLTRAM